MADKACKFLRDADDVFTNEIVNEDKFNNSSAFILRCPYENGTPRGCKNNYERINALGGYLYQNLASIADNFKGEGNNANRHIEIFTMWLGDKLYKLENNYKATLEQSYNNHLKKSMGIVDYWNLLDNKQSYKEANVWYMSELYSLLKYICDLANEYNKNPKSKQIETLSNKCYQKFIVIYNNIKDCYSYFHLLQNLKNIYDGIRNAAVRKNASSSSPANRYRGLALKYVMNASTIPIVELTTIKWNKKFTSESDKILDFNTQKCVELNTETTKKQQEFESKKKQKAEPQTGNDKSGSDKSGNDKSGNDKSGNDKSGSNKLGTKANQRPKKPTKPKKPVIQKRIRQQRLRSQPQQKPVTSQLSSEPQKQIQLPPAELQSPGSRADPQPATPHDPTILPPSPGPSQPKKTESPPEQPQQQPQSGPSTADSPPPQKGTPLPKPQERGSDSKNEPNTSDNGKENRGGASGGNGNTGDGSNGPVSSTLGGSFDLWSPFRGFLLNGTKIYNKTSQFIKESQQMLNDAKDKISNAYDNAVNNLKGAYSVSSSYFSDIISNISIQFNQVATPPKPGNSGNSMSQNNDQSQKNGSPSLTPPKDPPPQTSTLNLPLPDPLPTPSQHLQIPPLPNSTQQKHLSSPTQPITHNPTTIDPSNHKANTQLVILPNFNFNLKKPWNIFPTTWNGSGDCKPEIKFMNITLVCCTPEQCSLTGISVTLILIPIILSIAYKYLSREWTKKSEKKNMKRVIKLVDGNRKTKIIISSYDKKKDLKPVINSVDRKKYPLLNIYKLMQADPIPFINLFFLLIFFVYKRKSDFLEL
ncbi:PIR protein CIR protein [Plasmodium vinckei]|uniref:PIR protein CIR protein n=1 Tax=Plasmodium vinckei TaxID=5860 RepID=A0A6V7SIH6_PLAVN|nr:PIR protein CIR protein [Plasmodium vinckei]